MVELRQEATKRSIVMSVNKELERRSSPRLSEFKSVGPDNYAFLNYSFLLETYFTDFRKEGRRRKR